MAASEMEPEEPEVPIWEVFEFLASSATGGHYVPMVSVVLFISVSAVSGFFPSSQMMDQKIG
jgi:hypothetical protein